MSRASATRTPSPAQGTFDGVLVFGFKGCLIGVEQLPLWHNDDVEARRDPDATKNLSNQSFSSISPGRASKLFGRRDSEPRRRGRLLGGKDEQREKPAVNLRSPLVNQLKFGPAANTLVPSEAGHPSGRVASTPSSPSGVFGPWRACV